MRAVTSEVEASGAAERDVEGGESSRARQDEGDGRAFLAVIISCKALRRGGIYVRQGWYIRASRRASRFGRPGDVPAVEAGGRATGKEPSISAPSSLSCCARGSCARACEGPVPEPSPANDPGEAEQDHANAPRGVM